MKHHDHRRGAGPIRGSTHMNVEALSLVWTIGDMTLDGD
jgi:hypothetical protein